MDAKKSAEILQFQAKKGREKSSQGGRSRRSAWQLVMDEACGGICQKLEGSAKEGAGICFKLDRGLQMGREERCGEGEVGGRDRQA